MRCTFSGTTKWGLFVWTGCWVLPRGAFWGLPPPPPLVPCLPLVLWFGSEDHSYSHQKAVFFSFIFLLSSVDSERNGKQKGATLPSSDQKFPTLLFSQRAWFVGVEMGCTKWLPEAFLGAGRLGRDRKQVLVFWFHHTQTSGALDGRSSFPDAVLSFSREARSVLTLSF